MPAGTIFAGASRPRRQDRSMPLATTLLPDGLGDLWSILIALVSFATLFLVLEGLDRA
jgi:hypothetical protein